MLERIKSILRKNHFYQSLSARKQKIKKNAADCRYRSEYKRDIRSWKKENPNGVFLIFTPEHGNLGDHAIAKSEIEMLRRLNIPYYELTEKQLHRFDSLHILDLINGTPVIVHGGGYLGTLWFHAEVLLRKVVQSIPDSKVLCFPNTLFYEDSEWGKEELKKSIAIYNSHPDLTFYARERTSYDVMKSIYSNVRLVPDMVMALNESNDPLPRSGCLLCVRNDIEKTRSEDDDRLILEAAHRLFNQNVAYTDTVADYAIPVQRRNEELDKKFLQFKQAELVITDRLHGMVFAAITGTPCVVINSKSPKVLGCYDWIKNLNYIQFCNDITKIAEVCQMIPRNVHHYDNSHLLPFYRQLEQDLLTIMQRG